MTRKNEEVFGLCSLPNYHGHNYDLVVKVTGEINPETGYVFDMKELKEITEEYVVKRYDHRNLNLDVTEFAKYHPFGRKYCRFHMEYSEIQD